tara:strand:+ start:1097 stop:1513 length:417 start_codon:yes stop_codon:yes gene_type:complete
MRLYNTKGKLQSKLVTRFLIDWDKKSRSKIQFKVKQFLKAYWENHIVYEEFPVYGTRMKVDILNATKKIAVEVNGRQHSSFNTFFHNNSRAKYLASIKRDVEKRKWLEKNGFTLVEIEEHEVKHLSEEFIVKNGIKLI